MLRSIITTALRNMTRNMSFSLINLIGLAVSMSLSLFIILMVREQYSFDNFHEDEDQIFRVNTEAIRKSGDTENYASAPLPLGEALSNDYSFIDKVVVLNRSLRDDAILKGESLPLSGLFTDQSFFEVFNFELAKGNKSNALTDPNSLVITEATSERLFGDEDPVGKVIKLTNYGEYKITGVIKRPGNTHFEFEALGSLSSLAPTDQGENSMFDDWFNYYSNHIYIKVKKGTDISQFDEIFKNISDTNYAGLELESRDKAYQFYLQPLGEITPGPILSNQLGRGMPFLLLLIFGILAGIVMLMACLNYTQLTIAKSVTRAREIGVRKVIGANKWQVFFQFIGEAIIMSIIALICSYVILQLLKPIFLSLHIPDEFAIKLGEDFVVYGLFLGFAVVIGVAAGIFPALFLSSFNPSKVLKTGMNIGVGSKLSLRKVLMVIQLVVSISFVIIILMMSRQAKYMNTADYGINTNGIVNVNLRSVDFDQFANKLRSLSGVEAVGGVSHKLGTWEDRSSDYKITPDAEAISVRDFLIDENYLSNLDIKLLTGRNFKEEDRGLNEHSVVINERAVGTFELEDANTAIGKVIYVNDTVSLRVIGVTEDFNFRPLSYSIGPVVFRLAPDRLSLASIKLNGGNENVESNIAQIEGVWKEFEDIRPLEWTTMSDDITGAYEDAGMNDIVKIVGYISFLAVSIAFMGLLGMVMFGVQRRLKEIGIRKIFGASPVQIVGILNKSFAGLFVIAILIGTPIGYFLGNLFLDNYAFKADMGASIIIIALGMILGIGVLTISAHTVRAALANPIKWLRYE